MQNMRLLREHISFYKVEINSCMIPDTFDKTCLGMGIPNCKLGYVKRNSKMIKAINLFQIHSTLVVVHLLVEHKEYEHYYY